MSAKPHAHKHPAFRQIGIWGWNDERFWSKVDKSTDPNGCWLWARGAMSPSGALYGVYKTGYRQMTQARRIAYMSTTGEDIGDYAVTMTCGCQQCVNVAHMKLAPNVLGPRKAYLNV